MDDIFGFRISVGDLVVALLLAIVAERVVKLAPKAMAVILDYAARWSDRSRASRILHLVKLVAQLERDLADQHRQGVKTLWNLSLLIVNASAAILNAVFLIGAAIGSEIMRLETALKVNNDSFGLFPASSQIPYYGLTV